ncbi:MAG: hypothetical protein P8Z37_12675, partial [Acidobacteriota bacterium]
MEDREEFYWGRHPEIESLFFHYLDSYSRKNRFLSDFRGKIVRRTSAGFLNWIDHIRVLDSAKFREQLQELGFEKLATTRDTVYTHSGVLLPDIVLVEKGCDWGPGITLRVENIKDFSKANHLDTEIEGSETSPYRRMSVAMENGIHLWAIERRGTRDFDPAFPENGPLRDFEPGLAAWKNLDRSGDNESKAWQQRNTVVEDLVSKFGAGPAAHIVCRCEREYWLSRN